MRCGGGLRLQNCNPMLLEDVAIDFPDMQIVIAHPSWPWQDEALSLALHKPNVWIDLSGWSPKYFPPQLVQYANTLLKDRMLFGSDFPLITPDRWMKDFDEAGFKDEVQAADPEGQRDAAAGPGRGCVRMAAASAAPGTDRGESRCHTDCHSGSWDLTDRIRPKAARAAGLEVGLMALNRVRPVATGSYLAA